MLASACRQAFSTASTLVTGLQVAAATSRQFTCLLPYLLYTKPSLPIATEANASAGNWLPAPMPLSMMDIDWKSGKSHFRTSYQCCLHARLAARKRSATCSDCCIAEVICTISAFSSPAEDAQLPKGASTRQGWSWAGCQRPTPAHTTSAPMSVQGCARLPACPQVHGTTALTRSVTCNGIACTRPRLVPRGAAEGPLHEQSSQSLLSMEQVDTCRIARRGRCLAGYRNRLLEQHRLCCMPGTCAMDPSHSCSQQLLRKGLKWNMAPTWQLSSLMSSSTTASAC